jgi:hypothetical protein
LSHGSPDFVGRQPDYWAFSADEGFQGDEVVKEKGGVNVKRSSDLLG